VRFALITASAALALVLLAATPAPAKPIQNTQFALQTSQGQAGTLFYFRKHETGGRRFLFARIPVILTCGTGERIEQSFTIDGNLDKGDNDERLRFTEVGLGGDVSVKAMNVRLLPKPTKAKQGRRAAWKRARGTLTSDLTQNLIDGGARYCSSGPVQFDTAIVTRF
jgi:hypothetical protein